jgi:hypothetical protein
LASPSLTGTPLAPTATTGDSSTQIATTAFVQGAIIAGSAHAETLQATVRNNTGSTLSPFTVVYINGALGNNATVAKAQANAEATSSGTFAVTQAAISNNADGIVIAAGVLSNIDTSAYTDGDKLYLSPTVAGGVTTTKPSAPNHLVYVGVVTRSHPTLGTVSVRIANGFELGEIHDVALASEANNDLLAYESSTSLWKNKSFSTLGLLTSSTAASTYQTQSGMSSYLTSATAASTYQTQSGMSSYATLASPSFSGTPSLPTGTTAVTQTAGNNTTAVATTAFVMANAGSPAYATNAQTLTGTSTTTAINPLTAVIAQMTPAIYTPSPSQSTSVVSGAGAVANVATNGWSISSPPSAVGYAIRYNQTTPRSGSITSSINWSRPAAFSARLETHYRFQTVATARLSLGKGAVTVTAGTATVRSIACSFGAATANTPSALVLEVHDGTTLTSVTSSFTPTFNQTFDVVCYSDGAGNVTLYVNGNSVATTAAGPKTVASVTTNYECLLQLEIVNASAPSALESIFQAQQLKFLVN